MPESRPRDESKQDARASCSRAPPGNPTDVKKLPKGIENDAKGRPKGIKERRKGGHGMNQNKMRAHLAPEHHWGTKGKPKGGQKATKRSRKGSIWDCALRFVPICLSYFIIV